MEPCRRRCNGSGSLAQRKQRRKQPNRGQHPTSRCPLGPGGTSACCGHYSRCRRLSALCNSHEWEDARQADLHQLEEVAPRTYNTPRGNPGHMPYVGVPPITAYGGQQQRDINTVVMSTAAAATTCRRAAPDPTVPMFMRRNVPVSAIGVRTAEPATRMCMPITAGNIARACGPHLPPSLPATNR